MSTINAAIIKAESFNWANTQIATTFAYANTVNTVVTNKISDQANMTYSIYVPAQAWIQSSQNNPEMNLRGWYAGGANTPYATLDFSDGSYDPCYYSMLMPKSWDGEVFDAKIIWTHKPTTVNYGVVWGVKAIVTDSGKPINNWDWGPVGGNEVTDTGGDDRKMYVTDLTGTITPNTAPGFAWNPDRRAFIVFQLYRNGVSGSDTLAVDSKLVGVWIYYKNDRFTDKQ